jgi:hypothetical protein
MIEKIVVFIVRYKEVYKLYECLDSIRVNIPVYIINNYGTLVLPKDKYPNVTVMDNIVRPDFSTGHLSRNWNQAIINGFKNINYPAVDKVVAIQSDVKLSHNWYDNVKNLDKKIRYLVCGRGDEFQIFTPDGIRNVGLYDERFCNIGYQESDYFLRNLIIQPNNCCIIDYAHGRVNIPSEFSNVKESDFIISSAEGYVFNEAHIESQKFHEISNRWFMKKWNNMTHWREFWNEENKKPDPFQKEIYLYPYFECNINPVLYCT